MSAPVHRTGRGRARRLRLAGSSGAATALRTARLATAVPALAKASTDPDADVRKAVVLSLLAHRADPDARAALADATADPDADVRAYASRATT